MSAIERAMGYYKVQCGEHWQEWWVRDLTAADYRGRLVLRDDVVLIGWPGCYPGPVIPGCSTLRYAVQGRAPLEEVFYVHLACGRLERLAEMVRSGALVLPWRWFLWQRGQRSQRWRLERSERVLRRFSGGGVNVG